MWFLQKMNSYWNSNFRLNPWSVIAHDNLDLSKIYEQEISWNKTNVKKQSLILYELICYQYFNLKSLLVTFSLKNIPTT